MSQYLTPDGLEKLKKELDNLKNVKRKELAKRLEEAISFGDLSENAAYHEAKEYQGFLEGRISELESIIQSAVVVSGNRNKDQVQVGSIVEVKCDSVKQDFQIVGPEEASPFEGKISYESPIGKALLNRRSGETIEISTPQGKIQYKILKIK